MTPLSPVFFWSVTVDHNNAAAAAVAAGIAAYGLVFTIIGLGLLVLTIVVYWKIASKAGYNGALALLMFVPLANLIMLLIFAFSEWPIEQQLRALRGGAAPPMGWQPPMPTVPPVS